MNLSKNLNLAEMINSQTAKRLKIDNRPTAEHLENMKILAKEVFQPIREYFKVSIFISSGYRSEKLNRAIKGSSSSQHCKGQAIDIDMDNTAISNKQVFDYIKDNLEFDQLIWEFGTTNNPDWVHVSYAKNKNRKQILRAKKVRGKTVYFSLEP